jgi:hypothetical protein
MPYIRRNAPQILCRGTELTACLYGIGIRFATNPVRNANIEDTLISAATEALERGDGRLWAGLLDWWEVHHICVNADRLQRALREMGNQHVKAIFAGLAQSIHPVGRFRMLAKLYEGKRIVFLGEDYRYRLKRDGEVRKFRETCLAVPVSLYQHSKRDIFSPAELAKWHVTYKWRLTIGPTFRADLWAECELAWPTTAYAVAKSAYASTGAALHVVHDYKTLHNIGAA